MAWACRVCSLQPPGTYHENTQHYQVACALDRSMLRRLNTKQKTPNITTQVGALDQHAAECGGCSPSQLTPRTEAFYNAQRLAQEEESRQEESRQVWQHTRTRHLVCTGT